jgi:aminopeptidase
MDFQEYTDFIVQASTVDPSPLLAAEEDLAPVITGGRQVRIATEEPTEKSELVLTMDISPSRPVLSYGLRNFPDGEIFTSPDARSVDGEIFVDLPVSYGGGEIEGIYLKFEEGRIVEYRANKGHDHLQAIIETDDGSHRLGEVALGMNPGLDRVLKHPLFVEKVGGTLHIAIGASYEDCFAEDPSSEEGRARIAGLEEAGILNRSAQHVDIVTDFRPGGCGRSVFVDDVKLVVQDGLWVTQSES